MQPALADVVQNSTLPASAATPASLHGAMRSLPWCGPLRRAGRRSRPCRSTAPTTGKTIVVGRRARLRRQPARGRQDAARSERESSGCGPVAEHGSGRAEGRDPSSRSRPSIESRGMKIAVCVKEVPKRPPQRIDPATKRLDRSGEGTLNPFDVNAVEEALRLKEAAGDGEVVVVSIGPGARARVAAQGARDGRRPRRARHRRRRRGSDLVATSRASPRALERESADLVLFGQQASDSDGAVLWAAVAERLRCRSSRRSPSSTLEDGTADA